MKNDEAVAESHKLIEKDDGAKELTKFKEKPYLLIFNLSSPIAQALPSTLLPYFNANVHEKFKGLTKHQNLNIHR